MAADGFGTLWDPGEPLPYPLPYNDVKASDWYAPWLNTANLFRLAGADAGVFDRPLFYGDQPATRMEAVLVLRQVLWQGE